MAGGSQDLFDRAQECYLRHDPEVTEPHVLATEESLRVRAEELEGSDLTEIAHDRAGSTELLSMHSGVTAMDPADRDLLLACLGALVDDVGGQVVKRYCVELDLARRR